MMRHTTGERPTGEIIHGSIKQLDTVRGYPIATSSSREGILEHSPQRPLGAMRSVRESVCGSPDITGM